MRTFIALELPRDIRESISLEVGRLKRAGGDVRWVRTSAMHLTLKFLGEIEASRVEAIGAGLERAVLHRTAFPLRVAGTGTFPPRGRPRVIWAGIDTPPELIELHESIESRMEALGHERESRVFSPHLTLGRVKSPNGMKQTLRELAGLKDFHFGELIVRRVILFRSRRLPTGAEYSPLKEVELS